MRLCILCQHPFSPYCGSFSTFVGCVRCRNCRLQIVRCRRAFQKQLEAGSGRSSKTAIDVNNRTFEFKGTAHTHTVKSDELRYPSKKFNSVDGNTLLFVQCCLKTDQNDTLRYRPPYRPGPPPCGGCGGIRYALGRLPSTSVCL